MSDHFLASAERFVWPDACPGCGEGLPTRDMLRNQDLHVGQRCHACGTSITRIPETLGEGRHRRTWWIPVHPADRFSRLSGREILTPSTIEWEELGGGPGRNFTTLDPTRTLVPRQGSRGWKGALRWTAPIAATTAGPERITSVTLARGMLFVATEGGLVRFLDPATGKAITDKPLQLRQDLHGEPLTWPPTLRGWWLACTAERALVVADLSPMARNPADTLVARAAVHLPPGQVWATPALAIDREDGLPLFAAVVLGDDLGPQGVLRIFDPAPVRDREPPRLVAEVPMQPAILPLQLPRLPGLARAGQIVWVGRDGGIHAIDPTTWASQRLTPPPVGLAPPLPWSQGNLALTLDAGEEALWMVHATGDRHVLRSWAVGSPCWVDQRALDPRTGLERTWIACAPWRPEDGEPWLVLGGANYHEIHRRGAADSSALNSGDHWQGDLTSRANVPSRTVAPPVLTPAGVVTFHPLEVRLTFSDPDRPGRLSHARVDVGLCGSFASFGTFAASEGATVWCGAEDGSVVCVGFHQE